MTETCPVCDAPLENLPGIGPACVAKGCVVCDAADLFRASPQIVNHLRVMRALNLPRRHPTRIDALLADLERIASQPYHADDSERNHQAFARSHLRLQKWITNNEERLLAQRDEARARARSWKGRFKHLERIHAATVRNLRELRALRRVDPEAVVEITFGCFSPGELEW